MAYRILLKGAETPVPATAGAATSFSEATVVRFANKATGTDHTLTVKTAVGGDVVGTFTTNDQLSIEGQGTYSSSNTITSIRTFQM